MAQLNIQCHALLIRSIPFLFSGDKWYRNTDWINRNFPGTSHMGIKLPIKQRRWLASQNQMWRFWSKLVIQYALFWGDFSSIGSLTQAAYMMQFVLCSSQNSAVFFHTARCHLMISYGYFGFWVEPSTFRLAYTKSYYFNLILYYIIYIMFYYVIMYSIMACSIMLHYIIL